MSYEQQLRSQHIHYKAAIEMTE